MTTIGDADIDQRSRIPGKFNSRFPSPGRAYLVTVKVSLINIVPAGPFTQAEML